MTRNPEHAALKTRGWHEIHFPQPTGHKLHVRARCLAEFENSVGSRGHDRICVLHLCSVKNLDEPQI